MPTKTPGRGEVSKTCFTCAANKYRCAFVKLEGFNNQIGWSDLWSLGEEEFNSALAIAKVKDDRDRQKDTLEDKINDSGYKTHFDADENSKSTKRVPVPLERPSLPKPLRDAMEPHDRRQSKKKLQRCVRVL